MQIFLKIVNCWEGPLGMGLVRIPGFERFINKGQKKCPYFFVEKCFTLHDRTTPMTHSQHPSTAEIKIA